MLVCYVYDLGMGSNAPHPFRTYLFLNKYEGISLQEAMLYIGLFEIQLGFMKFNTYFGLVYRCPNITGQNNEKIPKRCDDYYIKDTAIYKGNTYESQTSE